MRRGRPVTALPEESAAAPRRTNTAAIRFAFAAIACRSCSGCGCESGLTTLAQRAARSLDSRVIQPHPGDLAKRFLSRFSVQGMGASSRRSLRCDRPIARSTGLLVPLGAPSDRGGVLETGQESWLIFFAAFLAGTFAGVFFVAAGLRLDAAFRPFGITTPSSSANASAA